MKVIAVVAVTLALFGTSYADDDEKDKVLQFYKCLFCSKDPKVKEEFEKCDEMKPEECKKKCEECRHEIVPEAHTIEERWNILCKNENGEAEKYYECIKEKEGKMILNEEEKAQKEEFLQCAKKIEKKHCDYL